MHVPQVIAELYQRGVDCGLESFGGVGVLAWVVDKRNRRIEQRFDIDHLDSIAEWLLAAASRELEAREGSAHEGNARSLLAELSGAKRKDAKQVTYHERRRRYITNTQD